MKPEHYHNLTDEELLGFLMTQQLTPLEAELARRLTNILIQVDDIIEEYDLDDDEY